VLTTGKRFGRYSLPAALEHQVVDGALYCGGDELARHDSRGGRRHPIPKRGRQVLRQSLDMPAENDLKERLGAAPQQVEHR